MLLPLTRSEKLDDPLISKQEDALPISQRRTRRGWVSRVVAACVLIALVAFGHWTGWSIDIDHLARSLQESADPRFTVISHYARPTGGAGEWCALHHWQPRPSRPVVVDAVPISIEVDMLEIRMREYAPLVSTFVLVESDTDFNGSPKPLYFDHHRARLHALADELGVSIVYQRVLGFASTGTSNQSFINEAKQWEALAAVLNDLATEGRIPAGSLILQSNVDQIVSRSTLELLTTCEGFPADMHLSLQDFRYSFSQPLKDGGDWRPRVVTTEAHKPIMYSHTRHGGSLLADAGWHCAFCLPTLGAVRAKMTGFSHKDNVNPRLLEESSLRRRVCRGENPFSPWPAVFSGAAAALQGDTRRHRGFSNVPQALKDSPQRWRYLLDRGCRRPNE